LLFLVGDAVNLFPLLVELPLEMRYFKSQIESGPNAVRKQSKIAKLLSNRIRTGFDITVDITEFQAKSIFLGIFTPHGIDTTPSKDIS
jgi:hypothetical protein